MFGGETRSLKGDSRKQVPTLLANIRLGFKGLSGTNKLVYYKQLWITAEKKFNNIMTCKKSHFDRIQPCPKMLDLAGNGSDKNTIIHHA